MKKFLFAILAAFLIAAVIEGSAYLFARSGFGKSYVLEYMPTYSIAKALNREPDFWTLHPVFGAWYRPLAKKRYRKTCFDVIYQSNSYGARDKERAKNSSNPRTLVLGDSFTVGWGVDLESRWTSLLEKQTKTEFLNFGFSGFSTTHHYLIYKHLAKNFSHSRLLLGIFPANDFADNDLEQAKKIGEDMYNPYFTGSYPNYSLTYFKEDMHALQSRKLRRRSGLKFYIKKFFLEFTYTYPVIREIRKKLERKNKPVAQSLKESKFYYYSKEEFDLMRFTVEKIMEEAQGKEAAVILIPVDRDFVPYQELGDSPLAREFRSLGRKLGFQLIDLLPLMREKDPQWKKYYFSCDGHWNEYGNQIAAHLIHEALDKK